MSEDQTTAAVQRYINALDGDAPADPIIRACLDRAAGRLEMLCAGMLYSSYPPPHPAAAESGPRRAARGRGRAPAQGPAHDPPPNRARVFRTRQPAHAWELNDLARRLDEHPADVELREELVPSPPSSGSVLSPDARRILVAIDALPDDEREAFSLVRIQALTQAEAAEVLGVSSKTVQRRLNRALLTLAARLGDLRPTGEPSGEL